MRQCIVVVVMLTLVCCVGCSADFPFKWRPSEQQKQAADLTVRDLQALTPYVEAGAEPIRREAQQAAEITQTYLGLPKTRPQPVASTNVAVLMAAQSDADRPDPTAGQVGNAIVDQATKITTTGFGLAELLLTAAGSITGVWGFGKVKRRVDGWKDQAGEAEHKAADSIQAIREIVKGISQLDHETIQKVKAAQQQSSTTEQLVSATKRL